MTNLRLIQVKSCLIYLKKNQKLDLVVQNMLLGLDHIDIVNDYFKIVNNHFKIIIDHFKTIKTNNFRL